MGAPWLSIDTREDKENMMDVHNTILFHCKKKHKIIPFAVNRTGGHQVKQNDLSSERETLYVFSHIESRVSFIHTERAC